MDQKFPKIYPGEYDYSDILKNASIIIDTNVLLDLYSYTTSSRDQVLNFLSRLNDRLWMPNQVAKEYHIRRHLIISERHKFLKDKKTEIATPLRKYIQKLDESKKYIGDLIKNKELKNLCTEFEKNLLNHFDSIEKSFPDYLSKDEIRDKLFSLYDDRVGDAPSYSYLKELIEEGKLRFESEIPPGYCDNYKSGDLNKIGDLIIWKQIIEYAKQSHKDIIFITHDEKEDWWVSQNNCYGARPELVFEIFQEAKVNYLQYNLERFMKDMAKYEIESVDETTMDEIKEITIEKPIRVTFSSSYNIIDNSLKSCEFPSTGVLTYIPNRDSFIPVRVVSEREQALISEAAEKMDLIDRRNVEVWLNSMKNSPKWIIEPETDNYSEDAHEKDE